MKLRSPKAEVRKKTEWRRPKGFEGRPSVLGLILPLELFLLAAPTLCAAATNVPAHEEIPPLRPPRAEIPPSFWEQYGFVTIILGVLLLALVCVVIWVLTRPKPPVAVPPEIEARRALEPLRGRPEDCLLLSRVSQVLRHYVATAFGLPPGELTTAEFGLAIAGRAEIGPELVSVLTDLLRQCDERKFSRPAPAPPLSAVAYALKLIDQSQARRAALTQPVAQCAGSSDADPPKTAVKQ